MRKLKFPRIIALGRIPFLRYILPATAVGALVIFAVVLGILFRTLPRAFDAADSVSALQVGRAVHSVDARRFDDLTNFLQTKRNAPVTDWKNLKNPFAAPSP